MDWVSLIGILLIVYGFIVFYITLKKPRAVWQSRKVRGFIKALGQKGTILFFYIWGLAAIILGFWLMTK